LIDGRLLSFPDAPYQFPFTARGKEWIDKDGRIAEGFGVPREFYPPELLTLCEQVGTELRGRLERFIKLLRWQQEIDGPHGLFEGVPVLYWRTHDDAKEYVAVGRPRQETGSRALHGIGWDCDDARDMRTLWSRPDAQEPLAHELIREAGVALQGSPGSALLLAATALETGVKMHAAKLAPDAAWLLSEMPSPPVFKLLRDYLPKLHAARGVELTKWSDLKPLFKDAQKLAEYRNQLTHAGDMTGEVLAALPNLIISVSDFLYVFDVVEGHQWAKDNVSHRVRTIFGWPAPRRARTFVKMTVGTLPSEGDLSNNKSQKRG
jgi:hypothetical protein